MKTPVAKEGRTSRSGADISNPAGHLATQDLRERGWNARLIERFLGTHDLTRPNGLKMGRRKLPPVKLYLETRVEAAEQDEDFLVQMQQYQDRREKAALRRAEKARARAEQLQQAAQGYHPSVQALPIRKGAVRQARAPYLGSLEKLLAHHAEQLGGLSPAEEKFLRRELTLRLDGALAEVYPWFPAPGGKAASKSDTKVAIKEAQPADWQSWDWD